jgi:O-antigen/teichoic acid export membrane protein
VPTDAADGEYREPSSVENVEQMPTIARDVTRQRAASDILMQVVVRVANLALGTIVTALLVRTLGKAHYGQWSTIFIVIDLIGYFATFGFEQIAIREASREPGSEFDWLGSVMMVRLILLGPVTIAALAAVVSLHESQEMLIAGVILVLAMPFGGISAIALMFNLRVDNRVPMLVLTLRSVLWGVAVLIIHLEDGGMIALSIAMVLTNLCGTVVNVFAARKLVGRWIRPTMKYARPLFQRAVPVGITGLLVMGYGRIDQVIVFSMRGSKEAGLYGSIYVLLESSHFVPGSILTTMAPVIAAAWPNDRERLLRAVRNTLELLCVGAFGALAFAAVASEEVVHLIFGAEFVEAAPILPILGGAFVLISLGYLFDNLVLVTGKQRRLVKITLAALVFNVAGNLAFVPAFGFHAAAWMTLATEALVAALEIKLVTESVALSEIGYGRVLRTTASALLLAALLVIAKELGAGLAVLVVLACVSYPALLIALGGMSIDDIREVLGRRSPAT